MWKRFATLVLAGLVPNAASAHELGFGHAHRAVNQVEGLTAQLLAGRIQEVQGQVLQSISGNIEEMNRLRSDARRRNDALAASCVEQKLSPAQELFSAARAAGSRLMGIPSSDIEGLNAEAKALVMAAERIGVLTAQARACLKINSGQVLTNLKLTPDEAPSEVEQTPNDEPIDSIVTRKPRATEYD